MYFICKCTQNLYTDVIMHIRMQAHACIIQTCTHTCAHSSQLYTRPISPLPQVRLIVHESNPLMHTSFHKHSTFMCVCVCVNTYIHTLNTCTTHILCIPQWCIYMHVYIYIYIYIISCMCPHMHRLAAPWAAFSVRQGRWDSRASWRPRRSSNKC
jgi:hypothetical protein